MKHAIFSTLRRVAAVSALAFLSTAARADVTGFGGTGVGWATNTFAGHPLPPIAADVLTITAAGDTSDAHSAWFATKQRIDGAWTATFVYTKTQRGTDNQGLVYWDADGLTFTFQNAGLDALGDNGGNIGYTNIAPSAGLAIKVYQRNSGGSIDDQSGLGVVSGGQDATSVAYQNRGTINFDALNEPITFALSYNPQTRLLSVQAVQGGNSSSFASTIDLPAALGSNTAFLGFTGGTGGASMTATVGAFGFQENVGGAAQPGTYAGLIRDGATDANENTGFARVEYNGALLSAALYWQGYRFPVIGIADGNGEVKMKVRKRNGARGMFDVTFSTMSGGAISVTILDGMRHAAGLLLPAVQSGAARYTAHIETGGGGGGGKIANGDGQSLNFGSGYATFRVTGAGLVKLIGRLPDGQFFSCSSVVHGAASFPLYTGQYSRRNRGSAFGTIALPNQGVTFSPFIHHRTPNFGSLYHAGFDATHTFVADRYIAPLLGIPVLPFVQGPIPNGSLDLEHGNLPFLFYNILVGAKNEFAFTSLNPMQIIVTIYRRGGTFHGTFMHPGAGLRKFAGTVVQGENLAAGLFLGPTEAGTIEFEPQNNQRQ